MTVVDVLELLLERREVSADLLDTRLIPDRAAIRRQIERFNAAGDTSDSERFPSLDAHTPDLMRPVQRRMLLSFAPQPGQEPDGLAVGGPAQVAGVGVVKGQPPTLLRLTVDDPEI